MEAFERIRVDIGGKWISPNRENGFGPCDMSGYGDVSLTVVITPDQESAASYYDFQVEVVIYDTDELDPESAGTCTQRVLIPVCGQGDGTSATFKVSPVPKHMAVWAYNDTADGIWLGLVINAQVLSNTAIIIPPPPGPA